VVFTALGMTTVFLEVSYVLVPFSRTARRIVPAMMVAAHLGILLLQRIMFIDLILLQLVFVDFSSIRRAIGRRITRHHRQIEVLYDGSCALCRRTVRLLGALDLFSALQFQDFRQLDLAAYNTSRGLNLEGADLDESMHAVARGRVFRGFSAYSAIAKAVPVCWPLVPFLFLPGIRSLGQLIYARIAPHRTQFVACDAGCAVEPAIEDRRLTDGARAAIGTRFGFALTLSVLVALTTACWLQRFEFYPFSAWHLYAMLDTSGTITYYKVMGHYDSGRISGVRLEEGVGALALDARYSIALDKCFGGAADVSVCEKFFIASAAAYNLHRWPGNRLTRYEIQTWKWDFVSNPRDPHYGQLAKRFIVDVTRRGPGGEKLQVGPRSSDN
jgi:predicted DCC family thiol-disulfide oxidoreductase YuxK